MPVGPGTKVPGKFSNGSWQPMPGWAKYCDSQPPEFIHDGWERWPEAGVCIAHGSVVGLDLDTDRQDVAEALQKAVGVPNVKRRGAKGWMGYYHLGEGLDGAPARIRWYDRNLESRAPVVELLLRGTQSVLPPTIHPETGRPYTWLTDEALEDVTPEELPEITGTALDAIDRELGKIGITRQAPRRVADTDYDRSSASDHDLEKPFGRSLNDRAMEAIDLWWPALEMPKSRQRGPGAWEAIPFWRASNSGRSISERNPNLRAVPAGIVDFGADRSYTPIDVVMAARDCSFNAATDWLKEFVRPETGAAFVPQVGTEQPSPVEEHVTPSDNRWAPLPVFAGERRFKALKPIALPTDADWEEMIPRDPPTFPIQDFGVCEGLLGEVASHIDAASATATEAGALAVALPLLGAVFGRTYATPTNLRTNVYTVALGGSGTGKTALVSPAKELLITGQVPDILGGDRFASGSGVLTMLRQGPRRVCFLDEFGHMLQQIGSAGAGIHSKQIITEFTALYSAAGTIFAGTAYADGRETTINYPHLCLFGMATPEQFWRAFGSSSLEDGSIARYLVFPLGETASKATDDSGAEAASEGIKAAQAAISNRVSGNLGSAGLVTAGLDDYAEKARLALKEKEAAFALYAEKNAIRGGPAILRRVTENALKIALISAVGRNSDRPEIDSRDMEIGHALAWWSANVMISNIASHIADNQLERDVNDVERFIAEAGCKGRQWRDIQRKFRRIRARDLKDVVESLEREGSILVEVVPNPSGGHCTKTYLPVVPKQVGH